MSAVADMRAMVDEIMRFVAERGDQYRQPGTPDHLLVRAASLMSGIASGLEAAAPMFELVRDDSEVPR